MSSARYVPYEPPSKPSSSSFWHSTSTSIARHGVSQLLRFPTQGLLPPAWSSVGVLLPPSSGPVVVLTAPAWPGVAPPASCSSGFAPTPPSRAAVAWTHLPMAASSALRGRDIDSLAQLLELDEEQFKRWILSDRTLSDCWGALNVLRSPFLFLMRRCSSSPCSQCHGEWSSTTAAEPYASSDEHTPHRWPFSLIVFFFPYHWNSSPPVEDFLC
jgi:hypothetical protein